MTDSYTNMNVREILSFYKANALFQSKHSYSDKFSHLEFFYNFETITIDVINQYCSFRSSSGVKNTTINREITLIRSALNYYLKYNESANFKNIFNGFCLFEKDYIPRYLDKSECRRLLSVAKKHSNTMIYDYIFLLLNTGCRSGELLTLTWDNVFLDCKYIIIRNSLSKNGKTIYKPINTDCIVSFDRLKRLSSGSKYVFYNHRTHTHVRSFQKAFKAVCSVAALDLRIHDLRHTFASFLVQNGVPIYQVSTLLGHSDTRITQRYAHIAPSYLHDAMKSLPSFS